jgi:ribonucleoside-diphosphate reductase alpha chain
MDTNENFLSPTAQKIYDLKYARELSNGEKETWEKTVLRVSQYVASVEEHEATELAAMGQFYRVLYEQSFLPGGRTLANAGTNVRNLMNCFVLPIEDSRESIYNSLKDAAEIFAWGGGVGYNFSNLRAKGSEVKTTGGLASGPLSFMGLYDQTGEVISQASRRGAQMGILNIDHPDIRDFIQYKNELDDRNTRIVKEFQRAKGRELNPHTMMTLHKTLADSQLTHFNLSVAVTDDYMATGDYEILELIAESAWKNGDPGMYFIDRANSDNMVPYLGSLDATNPCGEVPLLPYEACCLGSLNLSNFYGGGIFDWEYLRSVIRVGIRFLDNVQELNVTPVAEINAATRATRRLGLGVMGLADLLAEMGMSYGSDESIEFCDNLAFFIGRESWMASMELAIERGPFEAYDADQINWALVDKFDLDRRPVRNVAITSIAPTGTISIISDVNGGIEPFFAHSYSRNITEGVGNTAKETIEQAAVSDTVKTAHEIPWEKHVIMQAAWQNWVDNAVSKTINMPSDATKDDIMEAYVRAWELGLKGITVYRDSSKIFQILERK